jgi:hypothetical protein
MNNKKETLQKHKSDISLLSLSRTQAIFHDWQNAPWACPCPPFSIISYHYSLHLSSFLKKKIDITLIALVFFYVCAFAHFVHSSSDVLPPTSTLNSYSSCKAHLSSYYHNSYLCIHPSGHSSVPWQWLPQYNYLMCNYLSSLTISPTTLEGRWYIPFNQHNIDLAHNKS